MTAEELIDVLDDVLTTLQEVTDSYPDDVSACMAYFALSELLVYLRELDETSTHEG